MKEHHYQTKVEWTGNKGSGTDHYKITKETTILLLNKKQ